MQNPKRPLRFTAVLVSAVLVLAARQPLRGAESAAPAVGRKGMVSSAHPIATAAGLEILNKGGNAFDAAIAIAATLNVVEPGMSGMGGYGLILIYDAGKRKIRVLNASGRFPKAVDSNAFRPPTPEYRENRTGAKAVSTPVNLRAWEALSKQYGKLAWQDLFAPAIRAAEEGFVLQRPVSVEAFKAFPEPARQFYGKDGKPLAAGDRLVQKDLANSLRLVARQGPRALHGGEVGRKIDAEMRRVGSFLRLEDLVASQAEWYEPISVEYRGYRVVTASPPANSFTSLLRLGIMSQFDTRALGHNTTAYLHHFAEVTKHGEWCRLRYAGDPERNPPPLKMLLSADYWRKQAAAIDPHKARDFVPPVNFTSDGHDTTHFAAADRWGNIVNATQTLGSEYGSRVMAPGTGVWLNNSIYYCTFEPKGNPMDAFPGGRKFISNHPTFILKDGRPWAALGTPGGHTIGQTTAQMVLNIIDFGMDIQRAIDEPRISFVEPNELSVEAAIPAAVREELRAMGHRVRVVQRLGNAHGLTVEYDAAGQPVRFSGGSDRRGQGKAEGY